MSHLRASALGRLSHTLLPAWSATRIWSPRLRSQKSRLSPRGMLKKKEAIAEMYAPFWFLQPAQDDAAANVIMTSIASTDDTGTVHIPMFRTSQAIKKGDELLFLRNTSSASRWPLITFAAPGEPSVKKAKRSS